jgi:hypothetical protein
LGASRNGLYTAKPTGRGAVLWKEKASSFFELRNNTALKRGKKKTRENRGSDLGAPLPAQMDSTKPGVHAIQSLGCATMPAVKIHDDATGQRITAKMAMNENPKEEANQHREETQIKRKVDGDNKQS